MRDRPYVISMLVQRRRRWSNIETTLVPRLVLAWEYIASVLPHLFCPTSLKQLRRRQYMYVFLFWGPPLCGVKPLRRRQYACQ